MTSDLIPAQLKGDLAKIQSDVASLHAKTADTILWMKAHLIVIVPVCLMVGWVMGKTL